VSLTDKQKELIKEWGKIAEKYKEDKYLYNIKNGKKEDGLFDFGDRWKRVPKLRILVKEYIKSPTRENLKKFWNKSSEYISSLRTPPLGNIEAEKGGMEKRDTVNIAI